MVTEIWQQAGRHGLAAEPRPECLVFCVRSLARLLFASAAAEPWGACLLRCESCRDLSWARSFFSFSRAVEGQRRRCQERRGRVFAGRFFAQLLSAIWLCKRVVISSLAPAVCCWQQVGRLLSAVWQVLLEVGSRLLCRCLTIEWRAT